MKKPVEIDGLGYDIEFENAAELRLKIEGLKADGHDVKVSGEGMSAVAGAAQGATLDFADELYGAGRVAGDVIGGLPLADVPGAYAGHRDQARTYFDSQQAANPYAYLGGQIGGGMVVPGGIGGRAARHAQNASTLGKIGTYAGIGAAEGAAQGVGASVKDNPLGWAADAIAPGIGGAGLSLGAGLVLPVAKEFGSYMLAKLGRGPSRRAADVITDTIGENVDEVTDVLTSQGPRGALLDTTPSLAGLAGAAKAKGNRAANVVDDFISKRAEGAYDEVVGAMEDAAGAKAGRATPVTKQIRQTMEALDNELYKVVSEPGAGVANAVPVTDKIRIMRNAPTLKKYFDQARAWYVSEHPELIELGDAFDPMDLEKVPLDYLNFLKKAINLSVEGARKNWDEAAATVKALTPQLERVTGRITDEADAWVPQYGMARRQHARKQDILKAGERGRDVAQRSPSSADELLTETESLLPEMRPFQQTMFRANMMDELIGNKLGAQKLEYGNIAAKIDPYQPNTARKLELMSRSPEKAGHLKQTLINEKTFGKNRTFLDNVTGTRTPILLAAADKADASSGMLAGAAHGAKGFIENLIESITSTGLDSRSAEIVARTLTDADITPAQVLRIMTSGGVDPDYAEAVVRAMQSGWTSRVSSGLLANQEQFID